MKRTSTEWLPEEPAFSSAAVMLPELLHDYFKAGRKLDAKSSARQMHRFRLKTKRLRYTLEAFLPLYGPGLESRLEVVRPIQNTLGDFNDCEVLLEEMGGQLSSEVKRYLKRRAGKLRREFLDYWRKTFDVKGEEAKWENYLKRAKRSRPAK